MGPADDVHLTGVDEPLVRDVLCEYGELTRKTMLAYLPQDEPRSYLYERG